MNISPSIAESVSDELRLTDLLARQKAAFARDMYPSLKSRLDKLDRLDRMIAENEAAFAQAISEDFGTRSPVVTSLADVFTTRAAIRHAKRNLRGWMRPRRVGVSWPMQPGTARIVAQPLGVVGIIAPWNYPLQLMLSPLVGALAAGNRAMLKPSELTPRFAEKLKEAVAGLFAEEDVAVVTGDADAAKAFSALPFEHLVFTGSTAVGKLVAQAAARNLTPVTLELGGKSPAIIDPSADLRLTTKRLAWGKLLNSGQTCVAPDYALVPNALLRDFVGGFRDSIAAQYPTISANPDYTTIISERHFERLAGLVEDATSKGAEAIELLPGRDPGKRIFPPTVLLNATKDMTVMQEEIFGPILPIIGYETPGEAIAFVNQRDRPLALYWFGEDKAARRAVLEGTISGGVTVNDTIVHLAQDGLPFGGVGASGHGHYHGEYGFRALSKEKPVFYQSRFSTGGLLYPPYGGIASALIKLLNRFG